MTNLNHRRVRFGPFEADLRTRELWRNGIRIKLGGQPFQILMALLENPGQLVSRDEFRQRIWAADTFVDFSHGLNAGVNKLREAICDSPDQPRYIETLPRRGYRFIGKVDVVPQVAQPPDAVPATATTLTPPPPLAPGPPPRSVALVDEGWQTSVPLRRQTVVQLFALVVPIALIVVGVMGFFWSHWSSSPSPEEAELHFKQKAEAASRAELEQHIKQEEQAMRSAAPIPPVLDNAGPSETERHDKPSAANVRKPDSHAIPGRPPLSDSFLLRLERTGRMVSIFPERPSGNPPSIFRVDMHHPDAPNALSRVIGGWDSIGGPQPSPDGKKLAFTAGTNAGGDVWICNPDGSSPQRLTNMGHAGTPRWSPDSQWIAFDSDGRSGSSGIYVVSANGGPARGVVQDTSNNSVPSWSRDGKYIYFASNRGSHFDGGQLWKVPAAGGEPIQMTHQGGFSGYESPDGQTVYYAKHKYQNPEIWQVPANGGAESKVSLLHPTTWASWAITDKGILLLSEYNSSASQLEYFDFATRSVHSLATLGKASFWLSASMDGSSVWFSELTDTEARKVFTAGMD